MALRIRLALEDFWIVGRHAIRNRHFVVVIEQRDARIVQHLGWIEFSECHRDPPANRVISAKDIARTGRRPFRSRLVAGKSVHRIGVEVRAIGPGVG
jgi:hypothetical protein